MCHQVIPLARAGVGDGASVAFRDLPSTCGPQPAVHLLNEENYWAVEIIAVYESDLS